MLPLLSYRTRDSSAAISRVNVYELKSMHDRQTRASQHSQHHTARLAHVTHEFKKLAGTIVLIGHNHRILLACECIMFGDLFATDDEPATSETGSQMQGSWAVMLHAF